MASEKTSSKPKFLQSFANNLSCTSYASVFLCQDSSNPQPTFQQETYHDLPEAQMHHHPNFNIVKKETMIWEEKIEKREASDQINHSAFLEREAEWFFRVETKEEKKQVANK